MKMEAHFKETLNRAVANEPPVLDAWDRFEQRVGRTRRVRLLAAFAAAAAVAVASVIVVPKLGSDSAINVPPATQPRSPSPTPTPRVDPYGGWKTYSHDLGFTFRYPEDWKVYVFEGNPEVVAPRQRPVAAEGGISMSVYFAALDEEFDSPEWRSRGFDRSTRPDGRPFVLAQRDQDGGTYVDYRINWTSCEGPTPTSGCTPWTLVVTIGAGTADLWDRYGSVAERIVASIEFPSPDGPRISG